MNAVMRRVLALWGSVALPWVSFGAEYTFTKVAETDGSYLEFGRSPMPSINSSGSVAFWAALVGGGEGVFKGDGTTTTTIADTSGSLLQLSLLPTINTSGQVAFRARLDSLDEGIYLGSGGSLTTIAETASQEFFSLDGPSVNDNGLVAFTGKRRIPAGYTPGIFVGDGSMLQTISSEWDGQFRNYGFPSINNNGQIAFNAQDMDVFLGIRLADLNGTVSTLVDAHPPFTNEIGFPKINQSGLVTFLARDTAGVQSVFIGGNVPLHAVADTSGPFFAFTGTGAGGIGEPSLNSAGHVAFFASLKNGDEGIFTGPDPVGDKVIMSGDPLDGSTVKWLVMGRDGLNDAGQIAFWTLLEDGRSLIVRANPVPEPSSLLLIMAAGLLVCRRQ